ncbi:MAG: twin-arginine translocase TatA/TatE family subunit [Lentisphaeria bacterium]|nr:twin-arginine translocase TatA/TatE family subunit [Lentisphaeria bacterium]MBO5764902.1 twin-arginine translocase TatA/TatE family subunit [Lentisphaeria bacterium]MBO7152486.1 twin-arginine translocase TatA/TatE family subunit [Lentisphaeria bacterium]
MGGIGMTEILLICFVVLILFGAKRIPEVARALGKASREFKDAKDGIIDEINREPAEKDSEKSQDKSKEEK